MSHKLLCGLALAATVGGAFLAGAAFAGWMRELA